MSVGGELQVRRVVGADGRSRAYLNGQAVAVQLLREAGSILIDIHGQHEFQSLTRSAAQRELLDGYAGLDRTHQPGGHRPPRVARAAQPHARPGDAARATGTRSSNCCATRRRSSPRCSSPPGSSSASPRNTRALPTAGASRKGPRARSRCCTRTRARAPTARVSRALTTLKGLAALDAKLAPVLPMLEEAQIQVREAARELQHYSESLDTDAARQEQLERRLAAIEELARKHRVRPGELPERAALLRGELGALERAEEDLSQLRKELAQALQNYRTQALELSGKRMAAARALARDISARMQTLGMAGGRFEVDVTQDGNAEPTQHGIDQIEFRVSANPGSPPRALAKVASGGELSRLSLAVQVSCAQEEARCMVFDEVDAGIGGAVAEIVGRELRALGARGQVLCVTHLPQVASQAHHHLRVMKLTDGRTTRTTLTELVGGPAGRGAGAHARRHRGLGQGARARARHARRGRARGRKLRHGAHPAPARQPAALSACRVQAGRAFRCGGCG